jgi:glycosyltransferase involved in cell wall biosynthesis
MPGNSRMRLRTHHLPEGFLLPVAPTLWLLRRVVEPMLRVLDDNDVVFAPNFFPHANQLPFGRTLVATVHDIAFAAMPETVAPETLDQLRDRLPATLFRSDRLIAVSDATAGDLTEHLGVSDRRIHTIHEGLDPHLADGDRLADATRPGVPTPYLLFVSTLEPRKNVIGVLRAFRLVAEWGYPGGLVLVGKWGWRTEALRRELDGSAVADRIVHLDYLPRSALLALYRDADCLLFPSWLEGFGLPLLEAMACGTPVVTSGRSSMPEVAGPAAVYVDPGSPHGIASAVASLLSDHDHRRRLAEIGRARARRFDWSRAAAATAAVLRLAAGRAAAGDADEYRV